MRKCCFKWLCFGLLAVFFGTVNCYAQEKVIYRDYDRLGWAILDSLKRLGAASLFNVRRERSGECIPSSYSKKKIETGRDHRTGTRKRIDGFQVYASYYSSRIYHALGHRGCAFRGWGVRDKLSRVVATDRRVCPAGFTG